jgi:hypothetical protein
MGPLNQIHWRNQKIVSCPPFPEASQGNGAFFWLNAGTEGNSIDRPWPDALRDAFAARGYQEQNVLVIPSKKLVIVRFDATSVRGAWDMNDFISRVNAALPGS